MPRNIQVILNLGFVYFSNLVPVSMNKIMQSVPDLTDIYVCHVYSKVDY